MIVLIIILVIIGLLWSISGNSRRARESQERIEKAMLSQLPKPVDIDDYPTAVVEAVRKKNIIGAIAELRKSRGFELREAKDLVDKLDAMLKIS